MLYLLSSRQLYPFFHPALVETHTAADESIILKEPVFGKGYIPWYWVAKKGTLSTETSTWYRVPCASGGG